MLELHAVRITLLAVGLAVMQSSLMTLSSAHNHPPSPSMPDNPRSTRFTGSKYAPQATLPQDVMHDENTRPTSPVGTTLGKISLHTCFEESSNSHSLVAEEIVRSEESLRRQGRSPSLGSLGETSGVLTLGMSPSSVRHVASLELLSHSRVSRRGGYHGDPDRIRRCTASNH